MAATRATAWSSPAAWARFLLVAIVGLALDQWTKHYAGEMLGYRHPTRSVTVLRGVLYFKTTLNRGGVFGIGQGDTAVFIGVSIVALAFVCFVFATSLRRQRVLHIALGLILAGALGNLYDRTMNHGRVRDFILLLPRVWPFIFNIADVMLCLGVPLLMLAWLFPPGWREKRSAARVRLAAGRTSPVE